MTTIGGSLKNQQIIDLRFFVTGNYSSSSLASLPAGTCASAKASATRGQRRQEPQPLSLISFIPTT